MKIKMTKDLLNDTNRISQDAENLFKIGAVCDFWGHTESFIKYFEDNYIFDTKIEVVFGESEAFMTDEQREIYDEYTYKVGKRLFDLRNKSNKE